METGIFSGEHGEQEMGPGRLIMECGVWGIECGVLMLERGVLRTESGVSGIKGVRQGCILSTLLI